LRNISEALTNELSATNSADRAVELVEPEQKRWSNPLVYGLLMLQLGIVIVIFGKKIIAEQLIADLGTLIAVVGIGLLVFKVVSLISSHSTSLPRTKTLLESKPTTELPHVLPSREPASVTEHTTRHFEPISRERKAD
jgi:hypothetical protein